MIRASALALLGALAVASVSALAHQPSTAYLHLAVDARSIEGRLDLALADADRLLGLDADGDGWLRWGEVRAHEPALRALPARALRLALDAQPCAIRGRPVGVFERADGVWLALPLTADCAGSGEALTVDYALLFDVDPEHRALIRVELDGEHSAIATPSVRGHRFARADTSLARVFADHFRQGLWHVALGLDHLLFLTCLLLPAVVRHRDGRFVAATSAWRAFVEVATIVTAFTLAHAASLAAVALEWVRPPVRWVEAAVAATIVYAALNNVLALSSNGRLPWVAFGFGLVHGAGYASVLSGLPLSGAASAAALAGFNLGIEGAQLAVASGFLPLAYLIRNQAWYRQGVVVLGSLTIAAIGVLWFVQRAFDLQF